MGSQDYEEYKKSRGKSRSNSNNNRFNKSKNRKPRRDGFKRQNQAKFKESTDRDRRDNRFNKLRKDEFKDSKTSKESLGRGIFQSEIFEVYEKQKGRRRSIYTKSFSPGNQVYDEEIIRKGNTEYREWNPYKSKLGAAIMKGCPNIFIRKDDVVLYLGASTGTTSSHVSDIVGESGFVFALDFAPRVVRDLVYVCETRPNMAPLLEDAFKPENYKDKILPQVDVVFQDIAQRNQVQIFMKNVDMYLKNGGYGILAVKSRSIDVAKRPVDVFKTVREELEKQIVIVDSRKLDPYEKDHMIFFCKKK